MAFISVLLLIITNPAVGDSGLAINVELPAILVKIASLENEVDVLKNIIRKDEQTMLQLSNDNDDFKTRLEEQTILLSSYEIKLKRNEHSLTECKQKLQRHELKISRLEESVPSFERADEEEDKIANKSVQSVLTPESAMAILNDGLRNGTTAQNNYTGMKRKIARRTSELTNIAFHVVTEVNTDYVGVNQKIHFETILLNNGNGYHNQNGMFVAPVSGVYVFSVAIENYLSRKIKVKLVKNGEIYGISESYDNYGSFVDYQGDITAIMELTGGDEVWVANTGPTNSSYYGGRWTYFCGALLY